VSSLKNSQRPHADSPDLRILKIGPKEQPFGSGYDTSIRRWAMRPTELVSASRVAILENAEAARQLLLGQPTNTGAVRRLLACIVKDGLRTGDIVRRTRALIELGSFTWSSYNAFRCLLTRRYRVLKTNICSSQPSFAGSFYLSKLG
jgi:hypothetical protein